MFKLAVIFAVVAVATAKPGFLASPSLALAPAIETRTAIIGEKTIESHSNSVVHASAPVVTSYSAAAPVVTSYAAAAAAPVVTSYAAAPAISAIPAVRTTILGEKTIESHGNAVVHGSAPLITSYAAPAIATYAAAPAASLVYGAPAYGKTITSYGSNLLHGAHLL